MFKYINKYIKYITAKCFKQKLYGLFKIPQVTPEHVCGKDLACLHQVKQYSV